MDKLFNEIDENEELPIMESENIDETDSDLFRLKIAKELSDQLFIKDEIKNKQISRLTPKEIFLLTIMESIDEILDFPLYEPFARNYRVHKMSMNGLSRSEVVDLVKSVSSTSGEYYNPQQGESTGYFNRIKRKLLG